MTLDLPKSPNPHAVDDVAAGQEMASRAAHWLAQLDDVIAKTKCRDDRAGAALRRPPDRSLVA
jgi:hypothetical protein